jgi:hypothetical protein
MLVKSSNRKSHVCDLFRSRGRCSNCSGHGTIACNFMVSKLAVSISSLVPSRTELVEMFEEMRLNNNDAQQNCTAFSSSRFLVQ